METKITITRYNVTAMIGWAGICVGLIGCAVQYFVPSPVGFALLAIGLVGGGITVSLAGTIKTVTTRRVKLRSPTDSDS
ncbi:hypothetical protein MID00_17635 [Alcaligenes sp. NLF5-7]|uniref:hypothetical protein n=1 Tax=Alcaligenes sp. NLF5-7 TaxID=2918755 RepID=UPI0020C2D055|nr:hypothetical protein [Alcaligenes sp. NLF5-7]UTM01292.1 hypothetical protein MID00_17635 [Alcaligenes sp. NLF5-7]